jgi:hypothetical protein
VNHSVEDFSRMVEACSPTYPTKLETGKNHWADPVRNCCLKATPLLPAIERSINTPIHEYSFGQIVEIPVDHGTGPSSVSPLGYRKSPIR